MSRSAARYELYGLVLESDRPLSGLRPTKRRRADVRLRTARAADFPRLSPSVTDSSEWFHSRTLPNGSIYLRWSGLFEFLVSGDGRLIRYRRFPRASLESLSTYLLGQVLSCSMLLRGIEPLHATTIVVNGEAIAFVGDSGDGKSTLGAAFLARGFPLLTDDLLALERRNGRWLAKPGPARLKLFPSIAARVLGRTGRADPLNPGTSKMILRLTPAETVARAVPLRAIYMLSHPQPRSRARTPAVGATPLKTPRAFLEVIRSAFNLIQVDRARLANQFAMAALLSREVPLFRLAYPRRLASLDAVCAAVLASATLR